jgi:anti-anti-sigma factor
METDMLSDSNIRAVVSDNVLLLKLDGKLDTLTGKRLEGWIEILVAPELQSVILDLKNTSSLDYDGIAAVHRLRANCAAMRVPLEIKNPQQYVSKTLRVCGIPADCFIQ